MDNKLYRDELDLLDETKSSFCGRKFEDQAMVFHKSLHRPHQEVMEEAATHEVWSRGEIGPGRKCLGSLSMLTESTRINNQEIS